jgi:hypothetical protein
LTDIARVPSDEDPAILLAQPQARDIVSLLIPQLSSVEANIDMLQSPSSAPSDKRSAAREIVGIFNAMAEFGRAWLPHVPQYAYGPHYGHRVVVYDSALDLSSFLVLRDSVCFTLS